MQSKSISPGLLSLPVLVGALGFFVDIFDLLLFSIIRKPSLQSLGLSHDQVLHSGELIISVQMIGLTVGGIAWGIMGDKKGRLSVLFGSILLYSLANIANGMVQTVPQYVLVRFIAGVGLAGELGASITLVTEMLPKHKRGIGTSMVAGIGLSGAVFAYFTFKYTQDWRLCYKIGGGLGFFLLVLRVRVAESFMFESVKLSNAVKGNFFMFFTSYKRFSKYIKAILIGLPTWFVIGVMVNYSNKFATGLYGDNLIDSGKSVMFAYIGIAVGDLLIGWVSQYFESRKKALFLFYMLSIVGMVLFFSAFNNSDSRMYAICAFLGFSTGYWAIFNQMAAEQFGTNLRATAATTIPNMVRGALPLINFLFLDILQKSMGWTIVQSGIVTGCIVMGVTMIAFVFTEETYHKDLDFLEQDHPLP